MRPLLQPASRAIATVGFLIALACWCASQSYFVTLAGIHGVDRGVYTVLPWSNRQFSAFSVSPENNHRFLGFAFNEQELPGGPGASPFTVLFAPPGVFIASEHRPRSSAVLISVRHWVIVSLPLLFYASVQLIYRLRSSGGQPIEQSD